MSNILLWKKLAMKHERLTGSSKGLRINWSEAQPGLGRAPGERGRTVPTTTTPDFRMKPLLSPMLFRTKLIRAAASPEGRWASHRNVTSTLRWEASSHLGLFSRIGPTQSIASHRRSVPDTTAARAQDPLPIALGERTFLSRVPQTNPMF